MPPRRLTIIGCLLLLTISAMLPVVACRFIDYDDDQYVTANPHVQGPVSLANFRWEMTHQQEFLYHPLSILNFTIDHALWGLHPAGYHIENVLIHLASVALLFLILSEITGELARPLIATALWAVHPLRVESVAWVSERKDCLAMLFFLIALWAYVRVSKTGFAQRGRQALWHLLMLIAMALSLLAKPAFFTLPILALLLDYWPLGRRPRASAWRLLAEKIPSVALAVVWILFVIHIGSPEPGTVKNLFPIPGTAARWANAIVTTVQYLVHHVTIWRLATPYPFRLDGYPLWQIISCAILLAAITVLCVIQRRARPWLFVGWFWYCIALAPMSGVRYIADYSMADRYTYLPSIGLMLMLVWSVPAHWLRWPSREEPRELAPIFAVAGSIFVILTLAIFTQIQASYWRDSITLFSHSISVVDSSLAEVNLGSALGLQGDVDASMDHFERAIELYPHYALAWNNLGGDWRLKQNWRAAADCYAKALQYDPELPTARLGLGASLLQMGKMREAYSQLQQAIELAPGSAAAHGQMGGWYAGNHRMSDALIEFELAVRCDPRDAAAQHNLGAALMQLGKRSEGEAHLHIAESLQRGPRN